MSLGGFPGKAKQAMTLESEHQLRSQRVYAKAGHDAKVSGPGRIFLFFFIQGYKLSKIVYLLKYFITQKAFLQSKK